MLAGMDQVAGPELAAAVTNAGGFGTLGGARYTPKMLREMIGEMKALLDDKDAPFGVDLLIPAVGGTARKTNVSCEIEQVGFWQSLGNEWTRCRMEVAESRLDDVAPGKNNDSKRVH
jgi:NAD(P)H-dependent flavin oxidoreductase YrpB (nitropropane dioxygenase family)